MWKGLCALQAMRGRWKPDKGSGERREEASKALSRGTSGGVVICISICSLGGLWSRGVYQLKGRLQKGMLEKYWDSVLPLARDVSLTPRTARGRYRKHLAY